MLEPHEEAHFPEMLQIIHQKKWYAALVILFGKLIT
jgi:hypothetical protein